MRNRFLLIVCSLFICIGIDSAGAEELGPLNGHNEMVNYAIGVETVRNFKNQGIEFDLDTVLKGMKDGLAGGALLLPEKDLRNILISVHTDQRRKRSTSKALASMQNYSSAASRLK